MFAEMFDDLGLFELIFAMNIIKEPLMIIINITKKATATFSWPSDKFISSFSLSFNI